MGKMLRTFLLLALISHAGAANMGAVPNVGLLVTNANTSADYSSTGRSGTFLMRGITTFFGNINVSNNSFTKFEAPGLVDISSSGGAVLTLENNLFTSVDLPDLVSGAISFKNNTSITSVNLPKYTTTGCKVLYLNNISAPSIVMPSLTDIHGAFSFGFSTALSLISMPALASMRNTFEVNVTTSLTTLSLPALTEITGVNQTTYLNECNGPQEPGILGNGSALDTISLPSLTTLLGLIECNTCNITTFSLPALTVFGTYAGIDLSHNHLDQASVNNLLVTLAAASHPGIPCVAGGQVSCVNVDLRFQSPARAPTGAGATAKATLIAAGFNVLTD